QAEGQAYADQLTIVSGLTPSEALVLGMLPWKVEPILGQGGPTDAEYGRAVQEEAKNTVLGSKAVTDAGLRYARKEDAEEALQRLQRRLPNSAWAITHEVYAD